ncbi:hypothetical protein A6V36_35665 [Paraburkholderia ginsengiterrae]|uniref:Uncharacterized protein n=1 Tax=Paraburkholderia ginsengiterrae TaxID=1462993 RepID=A0A1A9N882_9BURK|nr:hypothetical protein [Paraburkholderia ginsengiterrae]OAJ55178.1 hypothetical protein A6V36_35665 [Paraburkholderia ginsengiterrae]OAJ59783.1 hypothetical protein A6V37_26930 [Paraburkholderia ginsengiterrae]
MSKLTRDRAADDGNAFGKDTVKKCWVCNGVVVVPRHFHRDAARRRGTGNESRAGFLSIHLRAFVNWKISVTAVLLFT